MTDSTVLSELEKRKKQLELTEAAMPSEYKSQYGEAIARLESKLNNRSFDYNPNSDTLYLRYADGYRRRGQQAMEDTVGKSAALTGGYSSSYAQNAGSQAYDTYLQKLNDLGLDMYNAAYTAYEGEGQQLADSLQRLNTAEQNDYDRWLDRLKQYNTDRSYSYDALESAINRDTKRKQNAYDNLYKLILSSGYTPSEQELASSGMSADAARALSAAYLMNLLTGTKASSSSSKSGSSSTQSTPSSSSGKYSALLAEIRALKAAGSTASTIASKINAAYSTGEISSSQRTYLLSL